MAKLLLAPMEGLLDEVLREILTQVGDYDLAVSEFTRVSGNLLPLRAFRRVCPELDNGSRTSAGTPLVVQLLGSDPALLAENATQLATLGPAGIDLNFGCPAPTVNRHGGGAMLLSDPEKLFRICTAVRRAIPATLPLSAKMRLGISDTEKTLDCARALAAGGIVSLVVHARTKSDGYQPPAHWEWVARIRDVVTTPVVANGEVWTSDDHQRCCTASDCTDVMLGRGAVADAVDPEDQVATPVGVVQPVGGVLGEVQQRHRGARRQAPLRQRRRHPPVEIRQHLRPVFHRPTPSTPSPAASSRPAQEEFKNDADALTTGALATGAAADGGASP